MPDFLVAGKHRRRFFKSAYWQRRAKKACTRQRIRVKGQKNDAKSSARAKSRGGNL